MANADTSIDLDGGRSTAFVRGRTTLLTYGMAMAFGFTVAALGPAMPLLREELGISRTVGGLHFSALAAGSVLAGFAAERLVRSWGRRRVFWLGGAGLAAGGLIIGTGWHPAATIGGAFVAGGFGAAMLAVSSATLSDLHPAHHEVAITELNTASSAGSVVPALLIGILVLVGVGWRPAFVVPLAIVLALALRGRVETFPRPSHPGSTVRRRLPTAYWFTWAAFVPAVSAEWAVGAWGAGYLVDVTASTEESAALLMTTFFGAMLVGRFLGSLVTRRVGALPLLVGAASVGLGGVALFSSTSTVLPVVAGLFVAGLGISMLFPMLLSLAIDRARDRTDVAAARVFIAAGGAVFVAPLTLGAIADRTDIRSAFAVVPGLFVLVVVLAALGHREARAGDR